MKPHRTHVRQQDQTDCGVACLLSLIQYYGGSNSFENLRRLSGTTTSGTTLLGLYGAAKECGFNAEGCEADTEVLLTYPDPVILHVVMEEKLQHYVVCYGTVQQKGEINFLIGDPAKGMVHLTPQELQKIWQSKACLTLTPNENFVKAATQKKAQRQWVINLVKEDAPLLGIAAAMGLALAVLSLSMAFFSQRLIDDILPRKNWEKLYVGIALLVILLLAKEGLNYLRGHLMLRQSRAFNSRIISYFYTRLLHLPKPFFDTRKTGDLTARLHDTARIQKLISQLAGSSVIDVLVVLSAIVFLFFYSLPVALVCLAVLPLFFLLIHRYNKTISGAQRGVMSRYAATEANYISTLQGIEPIKMTGSERLFAKTNEVLYGGYQDAVVTLGAVQVKLSFLAGSFSVIFLCGVLLYGGASVMNGALKPGELMAVLSLCSTALPGVANLALLAIPINEARIAFGRMFEFTAVTPEPVSETGPDLVHIESLCIQNLCFRYPGRAALLHHVSLQLHLGAIVAITGENGCGKSTLTQIIQRYYSPESGSITVNGSTALGDIPLSGWRSGCATVPQNIHLFNGTVLENIAFDRAVTHTQEVLDFLKQLHFDAVFNKLPQAVFTLVGEEGVNLSGGQRQMVALARALYRKPRLLILDEATSAMDRETEQFVVQLLVRLKGEMMVLFITHRLHILKSFCDRIYVFKNGTVEAAGTHGELISTPNFYSAFWKDAQAVPHIRVAPV